MSAYRYRMWKANNPISYLLIKKFERDFRRPDPGCDAFDAQFASADVEPLKPPTAEERAYLAELEALSRDELSAAVRRADEETKDRLEQSQPYNQPLSEEEVHHWARAEFWLEPEATALSLNRDPRRIAHEKILREPQKNAFFQAYNERYDLIFRRCFRPNAPPRRYLAWFDTKAIALPPPLIAAVEQYHPVRTKQPKASDRQELSLGERERQTFLKMIIGMAMGGYSYDPGSARNDAIPDIVGDLERHGVAVSDDTIRKKLQEATTAVLPQTTEKDVD